MSTITKLDPTHRRRRTYRAVVLKNPPQLKTELAIKAFAELALIHKASHLHGDTKQSLFERGLRQVFV